MNKVALVLTLSLFSSLIVWGQEGAEYEVRGVVEAVSRAARNSDFDALEKLMSANFVYHFTGNPSKTEEMEWHRENPQILSEIGIIDTLNCGFSEYKGDIDYVCTVEKITNMQPDFPIYRAAFSMSVDGTWRFFGYVVQ